MSSIINPNSFQSREEYLEACRDREIDFGISRDEAEERMRMYEADGEEWEGQYGGLPGY